MASVVGGGEDTAGSGVVVVPLLNPMILCSNEGFNVFSRSLRFGVTTSAAAAGWTAAGVDGQPSVLKSTVESPLLLLRSICGMARGGAAASEAVLGSGSGSKGSLGSRLSK